MTDDPGVRETMLSTGEHRLAKDGRGVFHAAREKNRNNVLFASFFTRNTPYEEEVKTLIKSLNRFGLAYYIEGLDGRGSWKENCDLKCIFLRDVLDRFEQYDAIVWLDSDSVVKQEPTLFFELEDVDFAVRGRGPVRNLRTVLKFGFKIPTRKNRRNFIELVRGVAQYRNTHNCVMYFKNHSGTKGLIDDWIKETEGNKWRSDQRSLDAALRKNRYYTGRLRLLNLPPTYAEKNHPAEGFFPSRGTIIQQNQVGVKFKRHSTIQR